MGFFSNLFKSKKHETKCEIKPETRAIVEAFGGISNITGFNNGAVRLRYDVKDSDLVDVEKLKSLGALEVLVLGKKYVEAKFGDSSEQINIEIREACPLLKEEEAKKLKLNKGNLAPESLHCDPEKKTCEVINADMVDVLVPADGKVEDLASLNDGVFSEKLLGDGFVVNVKDKKVVDIISPVDGKLVVVFPSKHAYGIQCASGLEILVHIGIDTVKLGGLGFTSLVKVNDTVKAGDKLATVDVEKIVSEGLNPNVILVVTPDSKLKNIKQKDSKTFTIYK
ncbi:PTS glucose transporter subunit IIA [Mycoplasmopsis alligatoris]|uniref:Phosphotransferase system, EIIB n=1 Tax=Mycoplasmopsis alligatoris A21JP2 TaxID=747682 RepID=D4XX07_9BACT|nr:PTS glucose transporter subunit IIA [Mycoplasmopsis alligatoris]EFF41287.1 phosphotransferase system, EIIB [Mycoplasmopsis alligatoris A21JP2]